MNNTKSNGRSPALPAMLAALALAMTPLAGHGAEEPGSDAPSEASSKANGASSQQQKTIDDEQGEDAGVDNGDSIPLPETIVTGEFDDEQNILQPTNTTAIGVEAQTKNLPLSITTIPQRVIEDQQAIRLPDVYRNSPNVQQPPTKSNTQAIHIPFIRGFQSNGIYRNGFFFANNVNLNLANIQRVEVVKGPQSVLFGLMEPGGVVNYVTKKPTREFFAKPEGVFGSEGHREFRLDTGGPLVEGGDVRYRLNISAFDNEFFKEQEFAEGVFVAPSIGWDITDKTHLRLDISYLDEDRLQGGAVGFFADRDEPAWDRDTFIGAEGSPGKEQQEFFATAVLTHHIRQNLRLRLQGGFHHYDLDQNQSGPGGIFGGVPDSGDVGAFAQKVRQDSDDWIARGDLIWDVDTGPAHHTVTFGTDYNSHEQQRRQFFDPNFFGTVNVFNPNNPTFTPINPAPGDFPQSASEREWVGVYVQDLVSLFDDKVHLLGNVRFDQVDQFSRDFAGNTSELDEDAVTGRFGALWNATDWVAPYASWSQSFVPNDATTVGGDLLDPEEGTQYEAGLKFGFFDERLMLTTSVFRIDKENVAVNDPSTMAPGSINAGELRSEGFELEVTGRIWRGLQIQAGYGHLDTEVIRSDALPEGSRLQGVPDNSANLWLSYDFQDGTPLEGFGLGAGLFYNDTIDTQFSQFVGGVTVDSSVRADFSMWYQRQIAENVRVNARLTLRNAFDEEFFVGGFGHIVQVGQPRTLLGNIGVEITF